MHSNDFNFMQITQSSFFSLIHSVSFLLTNIKYIYSISTVSVCTIGFYFRSTPDFAIRLISFLVSFYCCSFYTQYRLLQWAVCVCVCGCWLNFSVPLLACTLNCFHWCQFLIVKFFAVVVILKIITPLCVFWNGAGADDSHGVF